MSLHIYYFYKFLVNYKGKIWRKSREEKKGKKERKTESEKIDQQVPFRKVTVDTTHTDTHTEF